MNFVKHYWAIPLPLAARGTGEQGPRRCRDKGASLWHVLKPIVAYVAMVSLLAMGSLRSL